jgi:hypothetical protein
MTLRVVALGSLTKCTKAQATNSPMFHHVDKAGWATGLAHRRSHSEKGAWAMSFGFLLCETQGERGHGELLHMLARVRGQRVEQL